MTTTEVFLVAMVIIFTIPYLIWRLGRTEYFAPLVVVQIIAGILLGPGVLGAHFPRYYEFVFSAPVVQALNGVAWWGVILFVWLAGIELNLSATLKHWRETAFTAALALGVPLLFGAVAALLFMNHPEWIGPAAQRWQFVVGLGLACAVTALPIMVLFLDKLGILREPMGQRVLRYTSLDDIAVWSVFALILMDWSRLGRQSLFIGAFVIAGWGLRRLMPRLGEPDRWFVGLIWLALCSLGSEWAGLHFMVGAFLAGAVTDASWFRQASRDAMRNNVLMLLMPVFFLITGLRTNWTMGGASVFLAAAVLLAASVAGKLLGVALSARLQGWKKGEGAVVGWLLQTKALMLIVFASVLLDKELITNGLFTALLLVAVASTMLTIPIVTPMLRKRSRRE